MKLSKLYQPRNPQFWIFVILNLLSTAISYILRSHELAPAITLALVFFALANMIIGIRIALHLMRS
ncbi:MAG: hypothetical protein FJ210_01010 [Betaproteobacteria bacterium]|nr:hypothetical protein [Betaproteobacteria bacterium]